MTDDIQATYYGPFLPLGLDNCVEDEAVSHVASRNFVFDFRISLDATVECGPRN